MDPERNPYQSYLIRLWEDSHGRQYTMLERITAPRGRFYFNSLDELFLFLIRDRGSNAQQLGIDAGK